MLNPMRCISFESYIKPQLYKANYSVNRVVYLLNPTSNHNVFYYIINIVPLYIFWILHQTTTRPAQSPRRAKLYIFWILHQTTTRGLNDYYLKSLYIFWILHQTTTTKMLKCTMNMLYIFWILHQTTTGFCCCSYVCSCISFESYIKPQLIPLSNMVRSRCISFESYIKPQLSEHNMTQADRCISFESYIKPQLVRHIGIVEAVVYLLNPTSNHNSHELCDWVIKLYIFWILHQTTTSFQ